MPPTLPRATAGAKASRKSAEQLLTRDWSSDVCPSDLIQPEDLPATEQTIRTALLRLEELKLVEVRRGRAGSRLTPLGEAVLGVLGDK